MTTPTPSPVSYLNEEAVQLVLERATTVAAAGDRVPSPCISVCRVNAASGLCEGCFRTLGEISSWGRSSPDAQRALWQTIRQRIALVQG